MHVRSTNIHGDPARVDDGVAYLRDEVLPGLTELPGCLGLSMLADRNSGRCIAATAWTDEEAMRASAEEIRPIRARLEQLLASQHADVTEREVAVLRRDRPAGDGAPAQVTWTRITPERVEDLLDFYKKHVTPRLHELPGFCSMSLLVDRSAGRTVNVTTFESPEARATARLRARSLVDHYAKKLDATIVDVHEMELALAHLRVPATVLPVVDTDG